MNFKKQGYLIVPEFLYTKKLYDDAIKHADSVPGKFGEQTPNSPSYYGEPDSFAIMHDSILGKLEQLTEFELFKTYFYWRMYYNGAILAPHTDRPACEISGTLFLGGDPWNVFLEDYQGKVIEIEQKPGDILLYKGCDLKHWREPFRGEQHAQIFLHYVDKNGPNAWAKDDLIKEEVI